jgi:hypothetical protein
MDVHRRGHCGPPGVHGPVTYLVLLTAVYVVGVGTIVAIAYGSAGRLPGRWERSMEYVRWAWPQALALYTFG